MVPKVFVSHASEDRKRFVMAFAQRLRENGVDAWLDQWEMKPGDSLVDKIFEEGLGNAQAVVIVLSAASVNKPWVREELNVSVVKRLQKGLKIIPVVIDRCEVPGALQSTLWQQIDDLNQYDDAFERILNAIFDRSPKPPLGEKPAVYSIEPKLPGMMSADQELLNSLYRHEVDQGLDPFEFEIGADEDRLASVEILRQRNLIRVENLGPSLYVRLTTEGFKLLCDEALLSKAGAFIVNEGVADNQSLAERMDRSRSTANFLLDVLEAAGHLQLARYGNGLWEIASVSPTLKRSLTP
jgi:hypothetical protein